METVEYRSKLHLNYQDLLSKKNIVHGTALTLEETERIVGNRIIVVLKKLTDDSYELLDGFISKAIDAIAALSSELELLFPGKKFIKIDLLEVDAKE